MKRVDDLGKKAQELVAVVVGGDAKGVSGLKRPTDRPTSWRAWRSYPGGVGGGARKEMRMLFWSDEPNKARI